MIVSEGLLEELSDVLSRGRMRRYGPLDLAEAHVQRVGRVGVCVEIMGEPERLVPGDPKDDYLVALALEPGADFLVSGDPHLLEAAPGGVSVLTPRRFGELLADSGQ